MEFADKRVGRPRIQGTNKKMYITVMKCNRFGCLLVWTRNDWEVRRDSKSFIRNVLVYGGIPQIGYIQGAA